MDQLFECVRCAYVTDSQEYLDAHVQLAHVVFRSTLECDSCDFRTDRDAVLRAHRSIVHAANINNNNNSGPSRDDDVPVIASSLKSTVHNRKHLGVQRSNQSLNKVENYQDHVQSREDKVPVIASSVQATAHDRKQLGVKQRSNQSLDTGQSTNANMLEESIESNGCKVQTNRKKVLKVNKMTVPSIHTAHHGRQNGPQPPIIQDTGTNGPTNAHTNAPTNAPTNASTNASTNALTNTNASTYILRCEECDFQTDKKAAFKLHKNVTHSVASAQQSRLASTKQITAQQMYDDQSSAKHAQFIKQTKDKIQIQKGITIQGRPLENVNRKSKGALNDHISDYTNYKIPLNQSAQLSPRTSTINTSNNRQQRFSSRDQANKVAQSPQSTVQAMTNWQEGVPIQGQPNNSSILTVPTEPVIYKLTEASQETYSQAVESVTQTSNDWKERILAQEQARQFNSVVSKVPFIRQVMQLTQGAAPAQTEQSIVQADSDWEREIPTHDLVYQASSTHPAPQGDPSNVAQDTVQDASHWQNGDSAPDQDTQLNYWVSDVSLNQQLNQATQTVSSGAVQDVTKWQIGNQGHDQTKQLNNLSFQESQNYQSSQNGTAASNASIQGLSDQGFQYTQGLSSNESINSSSRDKLNNLTKPTIFRPLSQVSVVAIEKPPPNSAVLPVSRAKRIRVSVPGKTKAQCPECDYEGSKRKVRSHVLIMHRKSTTTTAITTTSTTTTTVGSVMVQAPALSSSSLLGIHRKEKSSTTSTAKATTATITTTTSTTTVGSVVVQAPAPSSYSHALFTQDSSSSTSINGYPEEKPSNLTRAAIFRPRGQAEGLAIEKPDPLQRILTGVTFDPSTGKSRCPECQYASSSKSAMKIHIRAIHMHEKPYFCGYCNYSAGYRSSLKAHQRAKHATVPEKIINKLREDDVPLIKTQGSNLNMHNEKVTTAMASQQEGLQIKAGNLLFTTKPMGNNPDKIPSSTYQEIESLGSHLGSKQAETQSYGISGLDDTNTRILQKATDFNQANTFDMQAPVSNLPPTEHFSNLPPTDHVCPSCSYKTSRWASLVRHLTKSHPETELVVFRCQHCRFRAIHKSVLDSHIQLKHRQNRLKAKPEYSFQDVLSRDIVRGQASHGVIVNSNVGHNASKTAHKATFDSNKQLKRKHIQNKRAAPGYSFQDVLNGNIVLRQANNDTNAHSSASIDKFACDLCPHAAPKREMLLFHKMVVHKIAD